jgi:hypothetical protein
VGTTVANNEQGCRWTRRREQGQGVRGDSNLASRRLEDYDFFFFLENQTRQFLALLKTEKPEPNFRFKLFLESYQPFSCAFRIFMPFL